MSLRSLIEAWVLGELSARYSDGFQDLWARQRVTVILSIELGAPVGRLTPVRTLHGTAQARLIADHPEDLPNEDLWAALSMPNTIRVPGGVCPAVRVHLARVSESIADGWCEQSLQFELAGEFTGPQEPAA